MFAARKTDNVSSAANYIEDVFSTYLFSGNSASQTITNGIDLSGKGGMVWFKDRTLGSNHRLTDTVRGSGKSLLSNSTAAEQTATGNGTPTSFSSTGFVTDVSGFGSSDTYVTWTFREQAKFFDVVTYTGDGVAGRNISHSLGSTPGCMIVKRTDSAGDWRVWHRSLPTPEDNLIYLNRTDAAAGFGVWNGTNPTSTVFTVSNSSAVNVSGGTYVAYLFAHDAGGFGASGTDNVISCGSFTYSAGTTVTLGYEPQWLLIKRTDTTGDWFLVDTMRGWTTDSNASWLIPNTSGAEASGALGVAPTSTGFRVPTGYGNGSPYIYIAIRRGPMKTPTSGTSVFAPTIWTGNTPNVLDTRRISGFGKPTDLFIGSDRDTAFNHNLVYDRLRGTDTTGGKLLYTHNTSDEATNANSGSYSFAQMDGITLGNYVINYSGRLDVGWFFGRAPGFFDVVCYTGTGANRTVTHNLGVAPELMIVKLRSGAFEWQVYSSGIANTEYLMLDSANAKATGATRWNSTTPTASVFSLGTAGGVNSNGSTYVAYLFATCAGVSKVGSYTGSGTTKQIDCGFTAGARFVLIKRTDSVADWYVWDTARGIVSGNDPYLLLNSTGAEVTNTDYIDPYSAGFEISSTAPAAINANGGTFIFLAIS